MKSMFIVITFSLSTFQIFGQAPMRTLEQLIDITDPGWPLVKQWIGAAKNKVEVLPVDTTKAKEALYKTQVTTRSSMGAVIYMTGGILVDDGWIRILGSGSEKLSRSLPEWNKGKAFKQFGEQPPFLLIADDVLGGFFMINGGGLGSALGKLYYLSPDNLEYEPLDLTYTEFLHFCFNNGLEEFYKGYRWRNWRTDVSKLTGDRVFSFFLISGQNT
ncbi:DUF2625 domain-containing protein [Niabella sp. W65]|nr:DUF2625 domain-containing protein [Niabella sp. W65]MCH7361606.1 DUF2625 domain-containing protein [Niabella sp. W65]ULT45395.1 DUF2625 domain-containing protein [Niabella sp. I65]